MYEFIDKTSEAAGTPINRKTMMALQGFIAKTTVFNEDGSMTQTNDDGQTLTITFLPDGSIQEVFVGEKTITRITRFRENGIIEEVVQ